MTREKMIKKFSDALEDLSEIIFMGNLVTESLYDELDDALADRDYHKLDALDIEYITGA